MSKLDKLLEKMRNNPRDWQLADIEIIADRIGIIARRGKGSHVSFTHEKWINILTIPAHKPLKPIYVKKFISLVDMLLEEEL